MKSLNGVERVLSQRLSLLADSGLYDVYLITCNQYGAPLSFPISDKVHHIDLSTRFLLRCSYHGLFRYIDRFVSKKKYVKAICHCLESINPDVITCVDQHVADLEAVLKVKTNAVKVVECHSGRASYFSNLKKINHTYRFYLGNRLKSKLVRAIEKFDKVVVMTEAEKHDWHMDDHVVCIPNMLAYYPTDDTICSHETRYQIVSIGRYAYQKGYDMLVEAWNQVQRRHPHWTLHTYGSCDDGAGGYDQLKETIEKKRIPNLFLHTATTDVYAQYMQSDFYVMSSRFESFGLVLIEAMSCGLPVVSFDCKYGPRSIISDGHTGFLVPANQVSQLAEAICSLIENEEKRREMAVEARRESINYHPDRIMPHWHAFYESLGKERPIDA